MRYYPVFIDLRGKRCVVVGGGEIAERKVETLLTAGAQVTVVSSEITEKLRKLSEEGRIEHRQKRYTAADLKSAFLVISTTDDNRLNMRIWKHAERRRMLCNVVDQPHICNFIAPSIVSRGRLQIAISTNGVSPALSQKIRKRLEQEFGPEYEPFLELLAELRTRVRAQVKDKEKRKEAFHRLVDSDMLSLIKRGDKARARQLAERIIAAVIS